MNISFGSRSKDVIVKRHNEYGHELFVNCVHKFEKQSEVAMLTVYKFPIAEVSVTCWKYVLKSCQPCRTLNTPNIKRMGLPTVNRLTFVPLLE